MALPSTPKAPGPMPVPGDAGNAAPGRILFVMYHHRYVRQFEAVIRLLADSGHQIHLGVQVLDEHETAKRAAKLAFRLGDEYDGITAAKAANRDDRWLPLVRSLRSSIDYLRYLTPAYANAPKLRARQEWETPRLVVRLARLPLLRSRRGVALLSSVLRWLDRAIPRSAEIDGYLREQRPDLLLVTPLVSEPTQADYVRSAAALGIRCGLAVASWDNLTNKGLIREMPERLYVWNEIQRREAAELHGVSPEHVVVTGAHTFDQWFGRQPSRGADEFRASCGLPAGRPFLLYLCSSRFVAKSEPPFVERWIRELRAHHDERLRESAVLVRPHPKSGHRWRKVDLSHLPGVVIWPPTGASTTTEEAKNDYFDSMHHCMGVVGLNTSGLIEATIVGRPVFTVLLPEFQWGQEGTLHFHYLKRENGGPLIAARTFADHFEQISRTLSEWRGDECEGFLRSFVRPHGLDRPATPILANAVEQHLGAPVPVPARGRGAMAAATLLLRPLARLAAWEEAHREPLESQARKYREATGIGAHLSSARHLDGQARRRRERSSALRAEHESVGRRKPQARSR